MNKEIYAQTTFNNQANGSVFYKEGKLNDPMLGNVNGIFQSWKYSFDTGKQIFKAKDSEKVYEKRLIKDPNGNPKWSQWVEICPGEANGIQAIAINNQPLLLPNADGAIKLQITPQMIDTYTKREIYDMINSKADEIMTSGYVYVHWVDGCTTPQEVLEHTFPEGGELSRFYIVEPKAEEGVANKSTYWYFNEDGEWKTLTDLPSLNAFVTQVAFNEHTQDKVIHITQEEREKWNDYDRINQETQAIVTEAKETFEEHANNINKPNSPHITQEEREKLLYAYDNIKELPEGPGRYVIENKNYVKDYSQYEIDDTVKSQSIKNTKTVTFSHGDALIAFDENFQVSYAEIVNPGNFIEGLKINLNNIILPLNVTWQLEADNGWVSDTYSSVNQSVTVDIPAEKLPKALHIKFSNTDSTMTVGSTDYSIEYRKKTALNIGDDNRVLPLNFVGPEGVVPMYNGKPLNEITNEDTGSARWGKITGNVDLQQDLIQKVNELVRSKVENPELGEPYRYDIYGNGTLKSIIQNIGEEKLDTIEISNGALKENKILIEGIKNKVKALRNAGYWVTNIKLVAENIACTNDADGEIIPVYFETDNIDYEPSPSVVGAFEYNWPNKPDFDKIYLRGGKIEYITNAKLEIRYVAFSDIKIGLYDEIARKYYNMIVSAGNYDLTADEYKTTASNIILESGEEIELLAKLTKLGSEYDYDDEKTDGKVEVYGEEIDTRYASREKFEAEAASTVERFENLNNEITERFDNVNSDLAELNARVNEAEAKADAAISDIDAKSAEIDGKLTDFQEQLNETNTRIDNLDETVKTSVENLLKADEENAEGDASIFGRVASLEEGAEETRAEIEEIKADYMKKDEVLDVVSDSTREKFDLILTDSGEFTEAVRSGAFEQAERILFHKGEFSLTDDTLLARPIDFTNIKYVKGELPCSIKCLSNDQVAPINYINTKFENIDIKIGDFVIEKSGKRTLVVEASGKTIINLPEYYGIIQIDLKDDAEITFTGAVNGKDYTVQVCQPDEVKNVKFTNFFVNDNADIEFSNGLDHQKSGNKTIIEITADNKVAADAFIIKEVIYGALEGSNLDGLIKVVAKNTSCKLYKTKVFEQAVSFAEDEIIGYYKPGKTFSIEPTILDGFAHNASGYDYTVVSSSGIEIGQGKCEEASVFTVPLNLTSEDEVYVEFEVEPQLVTFELDPDYADYTSNLRGFTSVQTKFGTAEIQFTMRNGFYAYAIQKDDEAPHALGQESLPWRIVTPARASRENFTVYIKPLFVALFNDFDFITLSSHNFDKSRICLGGANNFDIEAKMPNRIKEDPNYGTLYTQALLTLLPSEFSGEWEWQSGLSYVQNDTPYGEEDSINADIPTSSSASIDAGPQLKPLPEEDEVLGYYGNGSIELTSTGKDQTMSVDIYDNAIGKYITFYFGLPNGDVLTKEMYVANIDQFNIVNNDLELIDGKYILDTIVNENRRYTFTADLDASNVVDDYSGKWTISDETVASIDEINDNVITIQAKKIGTVTLSFKSNFTNLTSSVTIEVVTHAKAVSGPENMVVKQLAEFTPQLKWYDYNDTVCKASEISDTTGKFVASDSSTNYLIDDHESYLVVTNQPLNAPSKVAYYKYQTNDETVNCIESKVTIIPVELLISFKTENTNITGVKVFNVNYFNNELSVYNCKAAPDSVVTFIFSLKTGETLPEPSITAIESAFSTSAQKVLNVPGRATIDIKMPYHEVEFTI